MIKYQLFKKIYKILLLQHLKTIKFMIKLIIKYKVKIGKMYLMIKINIKYKINSHK